MADYESLKDKYRQSQAEVIDYFCRWTTDMTVRWLLMINSATAWRGDVYFPIFTKFGDYREDYWLSFQKFGL